MVEVRGPIDDLMGDLERQITATRIREIEGGAEALDALGAALDSEAAEGDQKAAVQIMLRSARGRRHLGRLSEIWIASDKGEEPHPPLRSEEPEKTIPDPSVEAPLDPAMEAARRDPEIREQMQRIKGRSPGDGEDPEAGSGSPPPSAPAPGHVGSPPPSWGPLRRSNAERWGGT